MPCDMPDDVLRHCIEVSRKCLGACADWQSGGDDAVAAIKADLDATYGSNWHVVAGKNFGSKVTHDARLFTFFYVGDKAVLIFKSG
jgi:dynein light chain LC8-type